MVCSSSEFLFRLDALKPETSGEFSLSVRKHLLKGVRGLIEAPSRLVIYRGFFKATPLASLSQAMAEATRLNKPVFAVLYDDKYRQLSKLDHSLGYFMEYEATKAEVHENFVVAILPVSEATHLVPTGTLEAARWFLLDKHGSILAQQDVYANADEGLKTVKDLVMYGQQSA